MYQTATDRRKNIRDVKEMKIGFIGCGNMARPIIKGVLDADLAEVLVTDIARASLESFCAGNGAAASTQEEILAECGVIVLAVKPQVLPSLLPEIAPAINGRRPLVISIAAGKTTAYIASFFEPGIAVARIFPNLNARVKSAVSAYCGNRFVSEERLSLVRDICGSFGAAFAVPEDKINIFGVLGGCAPAYTFMYIEALAKAAAAAGFDPALALEVAAKMTEGSAKLLASSDDAPETLVKNVCSPGGTTIEGVNSLRGDDFERLIGRAFDASLRRDAELAGA